MIYLISPLVDTVFKLFISIFGKQGVKKSASPSLF